MHAGNPWLAYVESLGAGAAFAALQAAYEALEKQGSGTIAWQPILAAGLLAGVGYLVAALRWLQTLPPAPPKPPAQVTAIIQAPAPDPAPTAAPASTYPGAEISGTALPKSG